jgi:hypothetical protein
MKQNKSPRSKRIVVKGKTPAAAPDAPMPCSGFLW